VRLIALIGFMAAGKTTVGRRLAETLHWRFIDVDREIEERTARSIADWFQGPGEPAFRAMEAELTATLLSGDRAVLALGGGWAVQPGAFDAVPSGARTIWLRVSAAEAVRRAAADPVTRPLLSGEASDVMARTLLEAREGAYRQADIRVDVDGRSPDDIVHEILEALGIDRN
jgi:shikimate kinase